MEEAARTVAETGVGRDNVNPTLGEHEGCEGYIHLRLARKSGVCRDAGSHRRIRAIGETRTTAARACTEPNVIIQAGAVTLRKGKA